MQFATAQPIPILPCAPGVRNDDVAAERRAHVTARDGVVFIGIAQEKTYAFRASTHTDGALVGFQSSRQSVHVNSYSFYRQDEDVGPAVIKSAPTPPSR